VNTNKTQNETEMTTHEQTELGYDPSNSSPSLDAPCLQGVPVLADPPRPSKRVVSDELRKKVIATGSGLRFLTLANPKIIKGLEHGYATAILHLAPANYSGHTVCKRFSQCSTTCLYHQGRGIMPNVQKARIRRTRELMENREEAMSEIVLELRKIQKKLNKLNYSLPFAYSDAPDIKLACRLNGLSDLTWETMRIHDNAVGNDEGETIFDIFPDVQFYDYTKYTYGTRPAWKNMPANYHLTFSFDGRELDVDNAKEVLGHGHNVMVVHNKENYKHASISNSRIWGYPTHDAEEHDLRFTDPRPVVLVGREKGYSQIAI
jgi:hypothetical protein